jgi:hypothetical protein
MTPNTPKLDPREEHFLISGPHPHRKLFLRFLPALNRDEATRRPVLYVHGATFPSALSIAHEVRIIRDYGMFERREAPQFYPEVIRQPTHN